jgi:phosphatidylserine synthase
MIRHYVEMGLTAGFLILSVRFAWLQQWSPASYFLFLAAFVDFDDWTHGPKAGRD